jgi:hypothetical protein
MAWEMIEPNGLTEELERIREEGIMEFFKMFFTKEEINFDLQAVIMLLGAGISYLVIRSNHIDVFGGLELNSDEGWKRMEKTFENITHGILKNR